VTLTAGDNFETYARILVKFSEWVWRGQWLDFGGDPVSFSVIPDCVAEGLRKRRSASPYGL